MNSGTLLVSRADVERLLTPEACIAAVEDAFLQLASGKAPPPGILGMHAGEGSFHGDRRLSPRAQHGRGNPIHFILTGAFR